MITCTISPCREIKIHAPSSPVEGEHNANTMAISIPPQLAGTDLAGCTMYACIHNVAGGGDKIPLEMIPSEDGYTATWVMDSRVTAVAGDLTFYFEWMRDNSLVAKTYTSEIRVHPTPNVDGEIESSYPSILQDHEARIKDLEENGPGPGYKIGDGLILQGGVLSVDTAKEVEADNTKPVTSGAVYMQLGNVEALLANI